MLNEDQKRRSDILDSWSTLTSLRVLEVQDVRRLGQDGRFRGERESATFAELNIHRFGEFNNSQRLSAKGLISVELVAKVLVSVLPASLP